MDPEVHLGEEGFFGELDAAGTGDAAGGELSSPIGERALPHRAARSGSSFSAAALTRYRSWGAWRFFLSAGVIGVIRVAPGDMIWA